MPPQENPYVLRLLDSAKKAYDTKNIAGAESLLKQAILVDPNCSSAYYNLAKLCDEKSEYSKGIRYCEAFAKLNPQNGDIIRRMAELYARCGNMEYAQQLFRKATTLDQKDPTIISDFLFHLNYLPLPEALIAMEHKRFGDHYSGTRSLPLPDRGDGRIRIGYVSPDFRRHALSFVLRPILKYHDTSQFDIYAYCNFQTHDETTEEFKTYVTAWRETAELTDEQMMQVVAKDQIDILVDCAGHTGNTRLSMFTRRAAPIQVSWFGYLNTTGVKAMDYRLTDALMVPRNRQKYYTERLWYVPRVAAFEGYLPAPDTKPLPMVENGYPTFGSFNSTEKINRRTLRLWAEILHQVPKSRLYMMFHESTDFKAFVAGEFAKHGIDTDRFEMHHTKPLKDFLSMVHTADIALDPYPYSGGATVYHLMSRGVPSLTYEGPYEFSRTGSAINRHARLDRLVATSDEEYIARAIEIIKDEAYLRALRPQLPGLAGTDGKEVVRGYEHAYTEMVRLKRGEKAPTVAGRGQ